MVLFNQFKEANMSDKFYCMYCGDCRTSILSLTNGHCNKNPEGQYCVPSIN